MPSSTQHLVAFSRLLGSLPIAALAGLAEASVTIQSVHREVNAVTGTWPTPVWDAQSSPAGGTLFLRAQTVGHHEPWGGLPLTNRVVSTSVADQGGLRGTASIEFHAYAGPSPSIPGGLMLRHEMAFTVDAPTHFALSIDVASTLEGLFAQAMPIGAAVLASDGSVIAGVHPLSWGGPLDASGVLAAGTYRAVYGFDAFASGDVGTGGQFAGDVHFRIQLPTPSAASMLGLITLGVLRRRRGTGAGRPL
jgi:hypothetical protein